MEVPFISREIQSLQPLSADYGMTTNTGVDPRFTPIGLQRNALMMSSHNYSSYLGQGQCHVLLSESPTETPQSKTLWVYALREKKGEVVALRLCSVLYSVLYSAQGRICLSEDRGATARSAS